MLAFFRRIVNSRVGLLVTLIALGAIALAFAGGDVTSLRLGGGGAGDDVATVGGKSITVAALRTEVGNELDAARQRQPKLDMAGFIAGGGLEGALDRLIVFAASEQFAKGQGMAVSKRSVDGQLASIPGLQGPDGKFDMKTYQNLLATRHLSDATVRSEMAQSALVQQMTAPTVGANQVPAGLAIPYAGLMLERREGEIGFVPTTAFVDGPKPTEAEIAAFYKQNIARYVVPERRVLRYAVITPASVAAKATPSEAEIAADYAAHRSDYAATEKRSLESVVVGDQRTAEAIVAKVKSGASLADAARAAGLEAATQTGVTKTSFAATTAPATADAVFAASKGALVGPIKAPLGFTLARVVAVEEVAGRSLDQARAGIVTALTARKTAEMLVSLHDRMDDALTKRATFDEIIADNKLAATTTPALIANGIDPDHPAKPDPTIAPFIAAAFTVQRGDPPQLVPLGADRSFAVVALGNIVPPAPRPFSVVHDGVAHDVIIDRARAAAQRVAAAVVAQASKGATLSAALAASGAKGIPAVKPLSITRADLAQSKGQSPIALLFGMRPGAAKSLEAPLGAGFIVAKLNRIDPHNTALDPALLNATKTGLGQLLGREYENEFVHALRFAIGAKTNAAALAKLHTDLLGRAQ